MATELDLQIPDDFGPVLDEFGKSVDFRTYPSSVTDQSTSDVTLGAPVDYTVKVSPPSMAKISLAGDGSGIELEVATMILLTHNGTTDAIAFTPSIGMPVIYDSDEKLIVHIEPIYSGDLIAAYAVSVEA